MPDKDGVKFNVKIPNICPSFFEVPIIQWERLSILRVFLLTIQILEFARVIVLLYIQIASTHKAPFDGAAWFALPSAIVEYLALAAMPTASFLTCLTGLDKIYYVHICLFAISPVINASKSILRHVIFFTTYGFDWKLAQHWKTLYDMVIERGVFILVYLYYNPKTRLIYVATYRGIVENHSEIPNNEISKLLLLPIVTFCSTIIVFCIIRLVFLSNTEISHVWWNPQGIGFIGFHYFFFACVFIYELNMFLLLDYSKRYLGYYCSRFTSMIDRMLIGMICAMVTISAICFTIALSRPYTKNPEPWQQYFITVIYIVFNILRCVQYPLLWKLAIEMWNLDDLSWSMYEIELFGKYSSSESWRNFCDSDRLSWLESSSERIMPKRVRPRPSKMNRK